MRRAVVISLSFSLSISLRPITPRGTRSRFMEERLAPPLLFFLFCRSSSIFVIAGPGTAVNADKLRPRLTFQEWIFIKRLRHTHLPADGIYELLFHRMVYFGGLLRRTDDRSVPFPSRHEHAPVGRWRIDVHACRNEASVSRTWVADHWLFKGSSFSMQHPPALWQPARGVRTSA